MDAANEQGSGGHEMHNSGKWITGIVFVLFFCTAAGYTGLASTKSPDSRGMADSGSGGSSTVSFPTSSFTFECKAIGGINQGTILIPSVPF